MRNPMKLKIKFTVERLFISTLIALLSVGGCAGLLSAEEIPYQKPPSPISDLVEKPPTPSLLRSPDNKQYLVLEQSLLPSIDEISQPELRLAGYRINPKTSGPSRRSYDTGVSYLSLKDNKATFASIKGIPPEGAKLSTFSWSRDSKTCAFFVTEPNAIRLWKIDIATKTASKLTDKAINCFAGSSIEWASDNTILVKLIPEDRGAAPERQAVPKGPIVEENDGRKRPSRTDPDLLKNAHDEELLDYYARSQIARIHLDGRVEYLGKPDNYLSIASSPDAKHLLVRQCTAPTLTRWGSVAFRSV